MDLTDILAKLVSFPSITPEDAGCQAWMIEYLQSLGYTCDTYDQSPVSNFFAYIGNDGPWFVFAGHTDVVPVGDEQRWHTDPFCLQEKDGMMYGRGVADMKGSLAAMLVAAKRFAERSSLLTGRLGFLITSGEEGDHYELGTPYVMAQLAKKGIHIDYCVVGEPSSTAKLGDVIKIGRRGSLTGYLTVAGQQGHVAYPHLAQNPIHLISQSLADFCHLQWDNGNQFFPPTSMQITHIDSGGHAGNVIPGELFMQFNFRYSTEQTADQLQQKTTAVFDQLPLAYQLKWQLNGEPFLTRHGALIEAVVAETKACLRRTPELSTSGGTSDARFIAPYGVEVIELGPVNATIHQVNESGRLSDLEQLAELYYQISQRLLS